MSAGNCVQQKKVGDSIAKFRLERRCCNGVTSHAGKFESCFRQDEGAALDRYACWVASAHPARVASILQRMQACKHGHGGFVYLCLVVITASSSQLTLSSFMHASPSMLLLSLLYPMALLSFRILFKYLVFVRNVPSHQVRRTAGG